MFLRFKGRENIASSLADLSDYLARSSSTTLSCSSPQDEQGTKDLRDTSHRELHFLPKLLKPSPQRTSDALDALITSSEQSLSQNLPRDRSQRRDRASVRTTSWSRQSFYPLTELFADTKLPGTFTSSGPTNSSQKSPREPRAVGWHPSWSRATASCPLGARPSPLP